MLDHTTEAPADIPLVVDLDGTLIKVDSLHEAVAQLASRNPAHALGALLTLRQGRAAFKRAIAGHIIPNFETVPTNEKVLEFIKQARCEGRRVYLATAADRRFAEAVSANIELFDGIFASEDGTNLKGTA